MSDLSQLEHELKELIITTLALEDCTTEDIESSEPLFGDGLGLDSVDALELGVALQMKYGTVIREDDEETREHFASVTSLASFVAKNRTK